MILKYLTNITKNDKLYVDSNSEIDVSPDNEDNNMKELENKEAIISKS